MNAKTFSIRFKRMIHAFKARRSRTVSLLAILSLVVLLTGAFFVQQAIADQDAAKFAQSLPSSAALKKQIAPLQKKAMALQRQMDLLQGQGKPVPKSLQKSFLLMQAKGVILAEKRQIIDLIRLGGAKGNRLKDLVDGYKELERMAADLHKTPTLAEAKKINDEVTALDIKLFANQSFVDVKGSVVDQSGRPLNGVHLLITKFIQTGYSTHRGIPIPAGHAIKKKQTVNGHFHVMETHFNQLLLKFSKTPLMPVKVDLDSGYEPGNYAEKVADHDEGWKYFVKEEGKVWVFRIVLKPKPPKVTMLNYNGALSEGPKGHGQVLVLSKSAGDPEAYNPKNVDLTQPKKLPPDTFYVTFKRDHDGKVLMKSIKVPSEGSPVIVPVELTLHLTGKDAGLDMEWSSSLHNYAPKNGYQHKVVINAEDFIKHNKAGLLSFYVRIGNQYGHGVVDLQTYSSLSQDGKVLTITQTGPSIQSKNYHSRYIWSQD